MSSFLKWIKSRLEWPFRQRQSRLMLNRTSYTQADFVEYFQTRGVDAEVAATVWRALAGEAAVEGFTPMPQDSLQTVFGLVDDDLEELVLSILRHTDRRIPSRSETATMPPVRTVEDLVGFVNTMKTIGPRA
jgi:hypothetical protein